MLRGLLLALTRPLLPAPLLVMATGAALLALVQFAGQGSLLVWIPWLLIYGALLRYAFILVEDAGNGLAEPRTLALDDLNATQVRPLLMAALVALLWYFTSRLGHPALMAVRALALLLMPAVLGLMCLSPQVWQALNPLAVMRTIQGLSWYYLIVLGVISIYAVGLTALLPSHAWLLVKFLLVLFCCFSVASVIGTAFHTRRRELGFEPTRSPERTAAIRNAEHQRDLHRFVDELYPVLRNHNWPGADVALTRWLTLVNRTQLFADARVLLERDWGNEAARGFLAERLVTWMIRHKDLGAALDLASEESQQGLSARLASDVDTLTLARHAQAAGRRKLALQLLSDFDTRFADSPRRLESRHLRQTLER